MKGGGSTYAHERGSSSAKQSQPRMHFIDFMRRQSGDAILNARRQVRWRIESNARNCGGQCAPFIVTEDPAQRRG